jgi:chemotaxis signal transduction protein
MKNQQSFSDQQQKWNNLKKRLAYAKELVNRPISENVDNSEILAARAKKMAMTLNEVSANASFNEMVLCRLGNEKLAIETQFVREVLPSKNVTPIPGLPGYFKGITNIRGEIISVVDIAEFLGINADDRSEKAMWVVLQSTQTEFAIEIDELIGIEQIPLPYESIKVATLQDKENTFLKTITTKNNIAVLDVEKIMSSPLLQVNQISENE